MRKRFGFLASAILVLIVLSSVATFWDAPAGAYYAAPKTKDPPPTEEEKPTKPPRPPTKRNPKDDRTPEPTGVPPATQVPIVTPKSTAAPPATPASTDVPLTLTPPPFETAAPTLVLPTDAPVPTSIPTHVPTDIPTRTPVPTREREQPPVNRPSETPAPTEMPSIIETPTATEEAATTAPSPVQGTTDVPTASLPSATPVPTGTPTSTPAATPTARSIAGILVPTPFASSIATNEILARPQSIDWNGDGVIDADDEWVELYNSSQSRIDLSGWQLSTTDGSSTATFTFPAGTTIAGKGYRVFYSSQTKLRLSTSGGEVRLLFPDHRVADVVRYPELGPDLSYVKSSDRGRTWTRDCAPSPHGPNCSEGATLTSTFNLSYFEKHIADVSIIANNDHAALATNALLAIILAFVLGFYGDLMNTAMVKDRAVAQQFVLFPAWHRSIYRARVMRGMHNIARLLFWVGTPIRLAALFVAYGFVLAFLDPSLDLTEADGWLLVFALTCSITLVSASVLFAQRLVLRLYGGQSARRVRRTSILYALATTIISRLVGFVPGVLFAGPTGYEIDQTRKVRSKLSITAIATLVLVAVAAWLVTPLVEMDAWFKTVALVTFAAAIQTLFIELLPLGNLHGRPLFESSRPAWFVVFALVALVVLETMLNPDGSSIEAFLSPTMFTAAALTVAFSVTSAIVWLRMKVIAKQPAKQRVSGPIGK